MGASMFSRHRPETYWSQSLDADDILILSKSWKTNDPLYRYLESKREKLKDRDLGTLIRTVAMYSPFQTFKEALIVNKMVLHFFNSWMWTIPDNKSYDQRLYSKTYSFYYHRYMLYCVIPRLSHSIYTQYRATAIFSRDDLKYTLESFSKELQVWCYKSNIM